ncbi:hypothetical protein GGF41_007747, partial [Coemansia sp. RSA 2531]
TTPPPLGSEMPPVSPFFARIRPSDIDDVRETVKRASISRRRNTLAGSSEQRSSWSSPICEHLTATVNGGDDAYEGITGGDAGGMAAQQHGALELVLPSAAGEQAGKSLREPQFN